MAAPYISAIASDLDVMDPNARTPAQATPRHLPNPPKSPATPFRWIRGEPIGGGTYGRVYVSINVATGEMMAAKQVEIPQSGSEHENAHRMTLVEAIKAGDETLKGLRHPNIVAYFGYDETPAWFSILSEYVPGESLGSSVRKHGKFGATVTRAFTAQILNGLSYLHSAGVIHGNLTSNNILVSPAGQLKISDFASGAGHGHHLAQVVVAENVYWLAPEVVDPSGPGYTLTADIWSLGCLLLEMWSGQRPWGEIGASAVVDKLRGRERPPVPFETRPSVLADKLLVLCFAIDRDGRPDAATLAVHAYLDAPQVWSFDGNFTQ